MELVLGLRGFPGWAVQAPKRFFGEFLEHLHDHFIPHHRNNYHPHIFSHRLTSLFALLLVTVKIFSISYLSLGTPLPVYSSAVTRNNIALLTNESRKSFNLNTLKSNPILDSAAQAKANDMASKSYFAHTSPDGRLPWNFIQSAGYNYIMAGENLAVNFTEAENVSEAWMNSPTHKANILNKDFEEIGIGIAQGNYGGKDSVFVVQMFGTPAEEKITLKSQPTEVARQSAPAPTQQALAPAPAQARETADVIGIVKPVLEADLQIEDVAVAVEKDQVRLSVKTSLPAVKVLAVYGQKARMLTPAPDGLWIASVPLQSLTENNQKLAIKVYDINERVASKEAAVFADSPVANYNFLELGQVAGKNVEVFGKAVNLQGFEHQFYLLFIASIMTCLILAIAIKRHVQHVSLVANGSFVAILAALLWMG